MTNARTADSTGITDVPLIARTLDETAAARFVAERGDWDHAPPAIDGGTHPPSGDEELDWREVVALRKIVSDQVASEAERHRAEHGSTMNAADRRLMGRSVITRVVGDHVRSLHRSGSALWSQAEELGYRKAVENSVFGYGRWQPLFELPGVENIEIHGFESVAVQYGDGRRVAMPRVADSDEELVEAIRFLGDSARPSRPFDDTHPTVTLALGDRFRLHAIGFGLSHRPSVVIRRHNLTDTSLAELSAGGLMPPEVAQYLDAMVLARKSVVISGDQGAGKTTLLRGMINSIPANERFGTLETDYELMTHLQPGRENVLALQSRIGHGERDHGTALGDVSLADLIPEALRQNLSRLVVGEVRGGEAAVMFEAMQAGTGTMSTTHSHSAASTMDRLASRVAQGGVLSIDEAYRQIAHNIDVFVHLTLVDDAWRGGVRGRYVSEIREVTGAIESDRPVTHLAFRDDRPDGGAQFQPSMEMLAAQRPFLRELPADGVPHPTVGDDH